MVRGVPGPRSTQLCDSRPETAPVWRCSAGGRVIFLRDSIIPSFVLLSQSSPFFAGKINFDISQILDVKTVAQMSRRQRDFRPRPHPKTLSELQRGLVNFLLTARGRQAPFTPVATVGAAVWFTHAAALLLSRLVSTHSYPIRGCKTKVAAESKI